MGLNTNLYIILLHYILVKETLTLYLEKDYRDFVIKNYTKDSDYSDFSSNEDDITSYFITSSDKLILGYFIFENLSLSVEETNFAVIGINFNLYLKKSQLENYNPIDTFFFSFNTSANYSLQTLFPSIANMIVISIAGIDHYAVNMSFTYENVDHINYQPVLFSVICNSSSIEWAIGDFYSFMVKCPYKCPICSLSGCLACPSNSTFILGNSSCACDQSLDYWDYSNFDQPMNCQKKYMQLINENYNMLYVNKSWSFNGNEITPFDLRSKCISNNQSVFGYPNVFSPSDVLSKYLSLNMAYSSYQLSFGILFYNINTKSQMLNLSTSSNGKNIYTIRSSKNVITCLNGLTYNNNSYNLSNLYDNPSYINISFIFLDNTNTNFALSNFILSISPCFASCKTCSNPSFKSCLSCLDENSYLSAGQCLCSEGMIPVVTDSKFICVGKI